MQFERGKDPKEALKIGERANALELVGVAEIKIDQIRGNWAAEIVQWEKRYERVRGESHVIRVLMGIEAMELNPEGYSLVYWPKKGDQPDDWTQVEQYKDMAFHLGKFVKYRDHIYRIPTYEEFKEFQKKHRSAPTQNITNWPRGLSH